MSLGAAGLWHARRLLERTGIPLLWHRIASVGKAPFTCPICGFDGPFADLSDAGGFRRHARCPKCGSLERQRLQYLVMRTLSERHRFSSMSMIHFSPEPSLRRLFREWFGVYETADLKGPGVDHCVNITKLPFGDGTYDCVYASHVLEHIHDDRAALAEIRRVLRPGGFAVLPVPLLGPVTVEYPAPNPHECGHVRSPGFDYLKRYEGLFQRVETFGSADYPERYQLYDYEERASWPKETMPLRPTVTGERHPDLIPVCYP